METEGRKPSRARVVRKVKRRVAFQDRADAGRELAERLKGFTRREDCLVLGLPRGGVPVAFEVARRLRLPLDVLLAQVLGVQGCTGQSFGAIAADNGAVLDYALIRAARITPEQVSYAMDEARAQLKERARVLREGRKPLDLEGKSVILVDDGTATGACLFSGLHVLKRMRPAQVVVAVPVCPAAACALLEQEADLLLALKRPEGFFSIGQFYGRMKTLSDKDVRRKLEMSERSGTKQGRRRADARVEEAS